MRFSLDLVAIYLFKFNNGNARAMIEIFFFLYQGMIEICSKSIVKTSELRHCSGVFVIDFAQLNGGWLIDLSKIQIEQTRDLYLSLINICGWDKYIKEILIEKYLSS